MVKTWKNLLQNQKADALEASSTTKFVQMMNLGWPLPIYDKVKFGPLHLCKTIDFSETIVDYNIKVDRCS